MSLPKNCIQDANIDYKMTWRTLWAKDLVNFATTTVTSGVGWSTLTSGYSSGGQGFLEPIGSTQHLAIRFASCGSGASAIAPGLDFNLAVDDVDNNHPIYFTCEFTTASALAAAITPVWYYSTLTDGNAPNRPATALTVAAASTAKAAVAYALKQTTPGYIGKLTTGGFANETLHPAVTGLTVRLCVSTLTNAAITTDFLYITRVMVGYTPSMTFGQGSGRAARRMKLPLQAMEQDPTANT